MTTAIVGGGIMGVTLGYFLSQAGAKVTIYEGSPTVWKSIASTTPFCRATTI
jgi:glycine/D-amino acid oxidase-like deaminating enzyme